MERASMSMRRFLVSRRRLLKAAGVAPAAFLLSTNATAECDPNDLAQITAWATAHVPPIPPSDQPDFIEFACDLWNAYLKALKSFDNTDLDDKQEVLAQALQRSGDPILNNLPKIRVCGINGTLACAIICAHKSKGNKTWPWGKVSKKMFDDAWYETKSEIDQVDPNKGLAC
jgi:hypothetical protein